MSTTTIIELEKELRQNVNKGVRYLDDNLPNWRKHINCDILDLWNPCYCIVGQLYLDSDFDPNLGFGLPKHVDYDLPPEIKYKQAWNMLTDIWKEKINDQSRGDQLMFPIAILIEGHKSLSLISEPENLPIGKSFRVILTKATSEKYQIADEAIKNYLKEKNGNSNQT